MLFNIFKSQAERKKYEGAALIEMQFCKLPKDTSIEKIVAVNSIENWENDSLYINDENAFYEEYSRCCCMTEQHSFRRSRQFQAY